MKLSEIITALRLELDDDQYDSAKIIMAANWNQNQLFNDTKTRIMETSDKITAGSGSTSADLPEDIQSMIGLYVITPRVYDAYSLFSDYGTFMSKNAGFELATPSYLSQWTDFGNAMRFSAPLIEKHEINIDYIRSPKQMVNMSDVCEIPDRYSEITIKGTKARLMELNEDYAEASTERDNLEPIITAFKKNEARGTLVSGPIVMRSGRNRRF